MQEEVVAAIPAYDEAATIGSVVLGAREHCDHVLVVDDGSTDATAEIARKAGARVISNWENDGKGAAVRRIFEFARTHDVDRLVLLDADWQHDPAEIPQLLEPIESGTSDIVIGSRYLDGERGDTPLYRRLGQWALDLITFAGSGVSVTDSQSGYRAFGREAIRELDISEDGFGVESEMLRSAREQGLEIEEVPISVNYDVPSSSTMNPLVHGVRVVGTVLGIVRDRYLLFLLGVPWAALNALS